MVARQGLQRNNVRAWNIAAPPQDFDKIFPSAIQGRQSAASAWALVKKGRLQNCSHAAREGYDTDETLDLPQIGQRLSVEMESQGDKRRFRLISAKQVHSRRSDIPDTKRNQGRLAEDRAPTPGERRLGTAENIFFNGHNIVERQPFYSRRQAQDLVASRITSTRNLGGHSGDMGSTSPKCCGPNHYPTCRNPNELVEDVKDDARIIVSKDGMGAIASQPQETRKHDYRKYGSHVHAYRAAVDGDSRVDGHLDRWKYDWNDDRFMKEVLARMHDKIRQIEQKRVDILANLNGRHRKRGNHVESVLLNFKAETHARYTSRG
ncbi:hypothetical protein FISHEDRAFT_60955 [Fistulina hepatica ATCC 64428]|uniref:Uncharacterized protein n=1 Tax=Fistulina hepatica ATCC 64428 TaxID=1128425 RepID=A0A0D7A403_9AGAR|nr:hypothetical protein FISHEDRAFT_60955 [Fistulina hepatica ATCC 64428]